MALDDAIASLEAMMAAKREADALNRSAVDAACKRFAELAPERITILGEAAREREGWKISVQGLGVVVNKDGTWSATLSDFVPTASALEKEMALVLVTGVLMP